MHHNDALCFYFFLYFVLLYFIVFFFFQAEDGIRDGHVTGVQTCALPISGPPWTNTVPSSSRALSSAIAAPRSPPKISAGPHSAFSRVREKTAFGFSFIAVAIGPSDAAQCGPRSEERRVGKEGSAAAALD